MSPVRLFRAALIGAALAVAATASFAQSGDKVTIHYNRCDSSYEGWGLHIWRDPGAPLDGVTWATPMKPTGTNDFGVFWQADAKEFPNGKVNYIVHKGDAKDQGGKDMSFDSKATKEIWVNNGDRKIYASLDDAKKGRAENPCK
jgi:hypothetical protein